MSASAFASLTVPTLDDSGYVGNPYHHVEFHMSPVMFMWWAKTPTGRQSKFWKTHCFQRLEYTTKMVKHQGRLLPVLVPTQHYGRTAADLYKWLCERGTANCCPKLPRGYTWQGPFLYIELDEPKKEGPCRGYWFAFKAPAESAGIPIRYEVGSPLHTAQAIASTVLAARAGAAG